MTSVTTQAETESASLNSRGEGYTPTEYDEETSWANTSRSSLEEVSRPSCVHKLMALKGGCAIRLDPETLMRHKPAKAQTLLKEEISK